MITPTPILGRVASVMVLMFVEANSVVNRLLDFEGCMLLNEQGGWEAIYVWKMRRLGSKRQCRGKCQSGNDISPGRPSEHSHYSTFFNFFKHTPESRVHSWYKFLMQCWRRRSFLYSMFLTSLVTYVASERRTPPSLRTYLTLTYNNSTHRCSNAFK
jgi:hypothetical protein